MEKCIIWKVDGTIGYCGVDITKTFRRTREVLHFIFFGGDNKVRKYTFLVICVSGLFSVLVDLDHIISESLKVSRPLHIPYFIVVGCVCISYHAYVHRRFHKNSLRRENESST